MVRVAFTQRQLRLTLQERIRASGLTGGLVGAIEAEDDAHRLPARPGSTVVMAVVVMRDFVPQMFAQSCVAYVLGLSPQSAAGWFRGFTKTVFLAGNPMNLTKRFEFQLISSDGSIGWFAPVAPSESHTIRRLLDALEVGLPNESMTNFDIVIPAQKPDGSTKILYVGVAGFNGMSYLIHLNHILSEGLLSGILGPGDRVVFRTVPSVNGCGPLEGLRVSVDLFDRGRLRAYGGIYCGPCCAQSADRRQARPCRSLSQAS
jgi:Family of unknown function (DUF6182)